jgi:hypothetical protein
MLIDEPNLTGKEALRQSEGIRAGMAHSVEDFAERGFRMYLAPDGNEGFEAILNRFLTSCLPI